MTTPITKGQTSLGLHYPGTDDALSGIPSSLQILAEDITRVIGTASGIKFAYWNGNATTPGSGQYFTVPLPALGIVRGGIVRCFGPVGTPYAWAVNPSWMTGPLVGQLRIMAVDSTRAPGAVNPGVIPNAGEACGICCLAWGDAP